MPLEIKRRLIKFKKLVRKRPAPVRILVDKIRASAGRRQVAEAALRVEAEKMMAGGIGKGIKVFTQAEIATLKANPALARKVNEEAAVQAAAGYGVNIRNARGKIDYKLARLAAEAAAIQSAHEMGFDIRDKRGKIDRRKALEAARAAEDVRAGRPTQAGVNRNVVAEALNRKDALLADAVRAAKQRGFSVEQFRIAELKSNPALGSQVAEEAIKLAAEKAGIDIFRADGSMDVDLAQQVAQDSAIKAAAEMGIDITSSSGQVSRRKALEAARLADAARAGKTVSPRVAAAVSRQDARIIAALDAVQRQGKPPASPATRQEAFGDAELAALVRSNLLRRIR